MSLRLHLSVGLVRADRLNRARLSIIPDLAPGRDALPVGAVFDLVQNLVARAIALRRLGLGLIWGELRCWPFRCRGLWRLIRCGRLHGGGDLVEGRGGRFLPARRGSHVLRRRLAFQRQTDTADTGAKNGPDKRGVGRPLGPAALRVIELLGRDVVRHL
ncbi:MAG: hypothetical protein LCH61_01855 [Proteobacteria bacterium]|nr:hypothetical protein [Pseudomonadota bacterium]